MTLAGVRRSGASLALWAAFALAVVAIGFILLRACGLMLPIPGWNFCQAARPAGPSDAERGAALRQTAQQLELEIARRKLACLETPPAQKPADDLSFLKGCWRTDPFQHTPQHKPGVSTYCFDDKGNGQLEYRRPSDPAYVCRTTARAIFEGQKLVIRDSDATCSDGGKWYADSVDCRRDGSDTAQCGGQANSPTGPKSWTVRMTRVP